MSKKLDIDDMLQRELVLIDIETDEETGEDVYKYEHPTQDILFYVKWKEVKK